MKHEIVYNNGNNFQRVKVENPALILGTERMRINLILSPINSERLFSAVNGVTEKEDINLCPNT